MRYGANKITVVFSESTISPNPAKQVARETGAKYGSILLLNSLQRRRRQGSDLY